jgi:hypothetical protein
MEKEPVETLDISVDENSFGKTSGGLPPAKPKLFGNKQEEYKKRKNANANTN